MAYIASTENVQKSQVKSSAAARFAARVACRQTPLKGRIMLKPPLLSPFTPADDSHPDDKGTDSNLSDRPGLCLSGGGYRATLFHIGGIMRLNECGLLSKIERFSSVSGGSITAGALAVCWDRLNFNAHGVADNLEQEFVQPLLALTSATIDIPCILSGFIPGISAPARIAAAYDKFLFHGKTLQDLPDSPVFIFNATNMRSGVLWRFSKAYAADYRIGMIRNPEMSIAQAVGASSAFPPVLSPVKIDLRNHKIEKTNGADLHTPPFTDEALLADGGVYDNLGLESVFKRHKTIFVSNGGGSIPEFPSAFRLWSTQLRRIITVMNGQHDSLRIRQLIHAYKKQERKGAYWGLNSKTNEDRSSQPDRVTQEDIRNGEAIRTRLNKFKPEEKKSLIKLGYCLADEMLRAHYEPALPAPDMKSLG